MSLMRESDPRFVHLERKVGLFVLVAIAVAVAVIVIVAAERGLLVPKVELTFTAESGKDLREGMAVKFSGFRIGKVEMLTLSSWAEVKVTMSIDRRYLKWIRADSRAQLLQEGLLGEPIIEITPGSPMAAGLTENDVMEFTRRAGLNDLLGELDEIHGLIAEFRAGGIGETLANANRMSKELLDSREHLDTVLASAEKTLTKMDAVAEHVGHTIDKSDHAVMKFDRLLESVTATSARMDGLTVAMETEFPLLLGKTNHVLDNLTAATGDLRQAAKDTPSMAQRGSDVLDETTDLLDAIQSLWPIRSHMSQRQYRTLPVDTDE
jgi:phospholipid/cholesterol/gamma-HCH transport system substrate-binding protein